MTTSVLKQDQNHYHHYDKTATEKRPVISLLYHPSTNRVRKIIQSNWSLLQSRAELAAIFSQSLLIAYKRDTNIRDMLVRSKLHQPATRTPWTTPCNQAKCGTCPFICTSTIHCTKCAQLYIGETGRTLDTASKNTLRTLNTEETNLLPITLTKLAIPPTTFV